MLFNGSSKWLQFFFGLIFGLLASGCQIDQGTDRAGLGELCTEDIDCISQNCVAAICEPNTGSEKREIGSSCEDNDECQTGLCRTGRCVATTSPETGMSEVGARCTENTDCISGHCERQMCQPDCPGEDLCLGEAEIGMCCATNERCLSGACIDVGRACETSLDCDLDERCLPEQKVCVGDDIQLCEYRPPIGVFEPQIECQWPGSQILSAHPDKPFVVMTPLVGNITDDNGDGVTDTEDVPDIIFTSYNVERPNGDDHDNWYEGVIRIVSGACNTSGHHPTIHTIDFHDIDASAGLAIGDLTGDGVMEIIAVTDGRRVGESVASLAIYQRQNPQGTSWSTYAYRDAALRWREHTRGAPAPSLSDIDGDGVPEIIVGNIVFDRNLNIVFDGLSGLDSGNLELGDVGVGNNGFLGPSSVAANFDGVGDMEIFAGNTLYESNGEVRWTYAYGEDVTAAPCQGERVSSPTPCDGFNGFADFDVDGQVELVTIAKGYASILSLSGQLIQEIKIPQDDCNENEGGPPNIGDFDGDGRPEIGTAGADYYAVLDLDCAVEPVPTTCDSYGVLWKMNNHDCSSRVTASSLFDFEADGRSEIVYADEKNFYILDGPTGVQLFVDEQHASHTRLEMPVVVDVDNDGNAEVVVPETNLNNIQPGLRTWGDALDNWVGTRRIWNQHAYHVTNISETGEVAGPSSDANWSNPRLNNFRQNVQGVGAFWAPDLVIDDVIVTCLPTEVQLEVLVKNVGLQRVGSGVSISLRSGSTILETKSTSTTLVPNGVTENIIFRQPLGARAYELEVDIENAHNECHDYQVDPAVAYGEDNNTFLIETACAGLDG